MVMIEGNPCLLGVRNLGRLRKLQREQEPKSPFVFTSERNSPFSTGGFARMVERAGVEAKLGFKAHPHMLRHACGFALVTKATIPGRCRLTSATATSSTPCDTPSCRRAGSRTSGGDLPPKVDGCALKLPRNGSCLASLRGHNIYINAIMSPIVVRVYRPVTVRPRQRSALTLSDGCLICLTGTALLRAVVPASVHHARRPRFVPIHLRMTQLVVGCSVNGMFGFGRPPFAQSP